MYGTKATFEQNNGENLPNLMKDKLQTQKMLQATPELLGDCVGFNNSTLKV